MVDAHLRSKTIETADIKNMIIGGQTGIDGIRFCLAAVTNGENLADPAFSWFLQYKNKNGQGESVGLTPVYENGLVKLPWVPNKLATQVPGRMQIQLYAAIVTGEGEAAVVDKQWVSEFAIIYIQENINPDPIVATEPSVIEYYVTLYAAYKNAAEAAAAAALEKQQETATIYENFEARFLGYKDVDPFEDNKGGVLIQGALYFNTIAKSLKVYNGTTWSGIPNQTEVDAIKGPGWTNENLTALKTSLGMMSKYPYENEPAFSYYVTSQNIHKWLIDAYFDIECSEDRRYSFAVINKPTLSAILYSKKNSDGTFREEIAFSFTLISGSRYYFGRSVNSPKSWVIADFDALLTSSVIYNIWPENGVSILPRLFKNGMFNFDGDYVLQKIKESFSNEIKYDSSESVIPWETASPASYGSPFTGWGAYFNKTGESFNAIRLPSLGGNSTLWKELYLIVKDNYDTKPIKAISRIKLDDLNNIICPLYDPITYEPKTLDDSSFSGTKYFIGYGIYGEDHSIVYCGTSNGTQSNYAGNSYYISTLGIMENQSSWSPYSSNPCIPMEHLLLTNPQTILHLIELDSLDERFEELHDEITLISPPSIEVVLPDTIYAVVGDKLQLFFRGMIKHPNPYVYDILVSCIKGKTTPRYFEYTPTAEDVGTTTFEVEVRDHELRVLGSKTCNLITKGSVQSPSTMKHVLCVGDSLTSGGIWCTEASRRLVGTGGAPAGLGLQNIAFLGRKTNGIIGWEGTGGWDWSSFAGAGRSAYKFYVSGVVTSPAIGSTYSHNGLAYLIVEVNITEGVGYVSATGDSVPLSAGTLSISSGVGDASITFSSSEADSANPFWEADTGQLDFKQYVDVYMNGSCDVIYFLLSWNGQTAGRTDFTSMITTAKTLVNHIHAEYPNCQIKIMGLQLPSLNGGMGANYGAAGSGYSDTYGMVITALNLNKAYQAWCNEAGYSEYMEFVSVSVQFDSENNMPESSKTVNTRSVKTELIGTNGVHPSDEGYYQIADAVYRNFVASFC